MRKFLVVIIFIVCLGIGAQAQHITGSTKLTVSTSTPSAGALLTGAVVTSDAQNCASSTISAAVPAGWKVLCARGFEAPMGGTEQTNTFNNGGITGGVTAAQFHSGGHALGCAVTGDNSNCQWTLKPGTGANEIYISFWEWYTGGPKFTQAISTNDQFTGGLATGRGEDFRFDPTDNNSFFTQNLQPAFYSEGPNGSEACYGGGGGGDCQGNTNGNLAAAGTVTNSKFTSMVTGAWSQWELDLLPSTCTSGVPNNDGAATVYQDGQVIERVTNTNISGCPTMRGDPSIQIYAGGYQGMVWFSDSSGGCHGANDSTPGLTEQRVNTWGSTPALEVDGVTPCLGSQHNFNRYLDDIIVLTK
jgi:hypothetical protein